MGLTQAQINSDFDFIQSDLAATNGNETVTIGGNPFTALRAKALTAEELKDTGWAEQYSLSIYLQVTDGAVVAVDTLVTMADASEKRVLNISDGPALIYKRLDLGTKYPEGARA